MNTSTRYTHADLTTLEASIPSIKPKIKNKRFVFDETTTGYEFIYLGNDKEDEKEDKKEKDPDLTELVFETPQPRLRYLNANNCGIKRIVVKNCPNLQTLFLFGNGMEEIIFEGSFPKLELIDLSRNALARIDLPVNDFPALKYLYLHQNNLADLSELAGFFAKEEFDFNVEKNETLIAPPKEIVAQGKDAVINYSKLLLKEQKQAIAPKYNFETKMLIIGEGGTGKTTLLKKLQDENSEMPHEKDTTFGINIDKWTFDIFPQLFPNLSNRTQNEIMVNCWDFGGQKLYHGTHQIFFGENSFYILVADTREGHTDFKYWFNTIEQLAGENAHLLVIINQKHGHVFKFDREGYGARFSFINKDLAIDLNTEYDENDQINGQKNKKKNKENIEQIIDLQVKVKTRIQQMPFMGTPLSATYIGIREELFQQTANYIDFSKLREICLNHDVADWDTIRFMSKYFTDIGAITHFFDDDLLRERVFLNSDWLVKTLYKVLDDPTIKEKQGRICYDDFCHIWKRDKLDFEIKHLTVIMDKFGLMYQVPGSSTFVVPAHLPTQKPYSDWKHLTDRKILVFKYEFDNYMPEGLMSHFIVALHTFIENHDNVWHMGMNVEHENTYAEIIETYGGKNTFQIIIAGERKRELLAIIRLKFKEILKPFKKLNYEELVPCNCKECKTTKTPHTFTYTNLLNRKNKGIKHVECDKSFEMVSVQELLDEIFMEKVIIKTDIIMSTNNIFISYSSIDRNLRQIFEQRLKVYLASAKNRFGTVWSDVEIPVGGDWNYEIQQALQESNIGILLVSPSFLGSKYCMGDEFKQMLERRKSEGYTIIPVLLRECSFQNNEDLKAIQFVKTYQSEYDVADLLKKDKLMPFDELAEIPEPQERLLNRYFLKVSAAIDRAVGNL